MTDVSIIIPTLNGEKYLRRVLRSIFTQKTDKIFEVIIIDSGSKDSTLEIVKQFPVKLLEIPQAEFGHGKTRNLGVEKSNGKFIVFLTQDAIPLKKEWLDKLINTFKKDDKIAGVYCRQIPHQFENPVTVKNLEDWVAGKEKFYIRAIKDKEEFFNLPPFERRIIINFDNVASAIRRDVWKVYPLPESVFAADHQWGKQVLLEGYKIAFQPSAPVIHSHDRNPVYEFKRRYIDHKLNFKNYGLELFPNKAALLRGISADFKNKTRLVLKSNLNLIFKLYFIIKNLLVSVAQDLGTFIGARWEKKKLNRKPFYRMLEKVIIKNV